MRILILGGDGMLGHQLLKSWQGRHDVRVTLRGTENYYDQYGLFSSENSMYGIDMLDFKSVELAVQAFRPQAIVNAVGIVKQRDEAQDAILSLEVNALLPHRLSVLCAQIGARLIHLSTDCVFSGATGMYTEDDLEDARDLYGRSKLMGEVHDDHAVTLRTSIIGLELARNTSLIEWVLAQSGQIKGYTQAIYSGFTTMEMARIIEQVLMRYTDISGLWHVASAPISKYDLLIQLNHLLKRSDIQVLPETAFFCDRSLEATRFNSQTTYQPPLWGVMLEELAQQIQEREA